MFGARGRWRDETIVKTKSSVWQRVHIVELHNVAAACKGRPVIAECGGRLVHGGAGAAWELQRRRVDVKDIECIVEWGIRSVLRTRGCSEHHDGQLAREIGVYRGIWVGRAHGGRGGKRARVPAGSARHRQGSSGARK